MAVMRRDVMRAGLGMAGLAAGTPGAWAQGASPYRGQTVRFLTARNTHQSALADTMAGIARSWGVDLQTRFITTDQLQKKVVIDFTGGADTWDLVYCGGIQRMYEWFAGGIIQEMTPLIRTKGDPAVLEWDGFTPAARKAVTYNEKILGLTVGTSDQAMSYRRDLIDHPEEKAAFRARYNYDLRAPDTYAEFRDVADFFTRRRGQKLAGRTLDKDFYGAIFANRKGTFLWHRVENVMMAFGVDIYDPATGQPGVDSPQAIQAAAYYRSLVPFLPPAHINMSSSESAAMFAAGDGALNIDYFDRFQNALEKVGGGLSAEAFGFTFPPSVPGAPHGRKHPFRSGPPVVSLFGRARAPEAAYKLLEAACTAERQTAMTRSHPGYHPSKEAALHTLIEREPVTRYLLQVTEQGVDAMTDVDIMPYPSILRASKIGDVMAEAMAAILVGAAPEGELRKAQQALAAEFASLRAAN
jgi:multiple sugar transport system substrate-binding protein